MAAARREGDADALARFLRERREAIVEAWREEVRPGAPGLGPSAPALGALLPELLDGLGDAVLGTPPAPGRSDGLLASLSSGTPLAAVLAELAALRRALGRLWDPHRRPGDGSERLHAELDRLVAAAVEATARSRERTLLAIDRLGGMPLPPGDLGTAVAPLVEALRGAVPGVDEVTLLLREGDSLVVAAQHGLVDEAADGPPRLRVGEGFAGTIAATGQPMEVLDPAADPRVLRGSPKRSGLKCLYGVPLRREGEVLGVAHIGSRTQPRFSAGERLIFRTMVDRVAIALAERDLRRAVEREHEAAMDGRRQLQTLLDVLPVGVFVADRFGRLIAHNAAVARIWGEIPTAVGPERYGEFVGYRVEDGARLAGGDWALARALEGETVLDQEVDIVRFDGQSATILNSAAPIRDDAGGVAGAVAVNFDVTDRRRSDRHRAFLAEVGRALSESLDYDATLHRLADLVVPRLAEWCAIDLVENEGVRRVAVADAAPERTGPAAARPGEELPTAGLDASARVIESGEPMFVPELTAEAVRSLPADSSPCVEELRALGLGSFLAVPLVARRGTLGALQIALGTAARRFVPADLDLAREVAARAALAVDNARLYRDAREAIRARDDLWAVAAHELKNPLAALLLLLQGSKRAVERGEPVALERLDRATGQVRRLAALVGDLLDSTRAQSGRLELRREEVDLAAVAQEVVERHRPEARAAGTTVSFDTRAKPVGCWDPGRLDQVLTNLVGNAVKYGGATGIDVVVDRADGEALLRVADHGPGISPDDRERIFEPFERTKEAGRKQGLGLGLYIVRRIVEAHGGRIELGPTPGGGATFTVRLPMTACPEPEE